jgi:hypothetical protein
MKQLISKAVLAMLVFLTSQFVSAQSDTAKAWMNYMTPGEVHKVIASWDGEWNEEITLWQGPGAQPSKSTASCVNKMILGGRYQESKHVGNFMGMPFEGQSTLAWDNARKVLISTWVDNFGTGIMYMEGTWDDKTKTANFKGTMTDPLSGKLTNIRELYKVVDNNTHLMEQYATQEGKEYKTIEIKFTRKG